MTKISLPYVVSDLDRHDNRRYYFRRRSKHSPKALKIRLPGLPGSKEFMDAYQAALLGIENQPCKFSYSPRGSFGYVCKRYYASADFRMLHPSTQSWRRRVLDEICRSHGDKSIAKMQSRHVRMLRDEKAQTPSASENRLKALRALFKWAVEAGEVSHDPTRDVRKLKHHSEGHHSWTIEEVKQFEGTHPVGSKPRLAMALMLYTGCRRADVVSLGPRHIKDGRLLYRQAKNANRSPVDIDIPILDDLANIVDQTECRSLTFLVTEFGRPFSVAGFGNKFRQWCDQAGLHHCSAHGLRKAIAARLAEAGAEPHQIMAITGHRSLKEVERYTRAARKP